jgi:hypothetical protein
MKTFQARDFRNALIVLVCLSTLLTRTATSAITGPNLHLEGIQKVTEAGGQSATRQGPGTSDPAERSILQNSRTKAAALPPLEMLPPNSKLNAVFPVIGLMAAVTVTQLLRRRRIAQLRSSASAGQ